MTAPALSAVDRLYSAFIGPKRTNYYLKQFAEFDRPGSFQLSWNWAAFLLPMGIWLIYRKMWRYAAIYLGSTALLSLAMRDGGETEKFVFAMVLLLIPPAAGNYLYYRHLNNKIGQALIVTRDPERMQTILAKQGGVSRVGLWLGVAYLFCFAIGTALSVLIPYLTNA